MPSDQPGNAALDPGFFDGRFLIEIETWEPNLHVGLSRKSIPEEYRSPDGLDYLRNFDIRGRVAAPKAHRDKSIRVWLSPIGAEMRFGDEEEEMDEVGRLYFRSESGTLGPSASLMLPESALSFTVSCLASCWRYLHLWTFDERDEEASVSKFSFSSTIHKNLDPWVLEE